MSRLAPMLLLALVSPLLFPGGRAMAATPPLLSGQDSTGTEALARTEARTAALSWLALVDTGKYAESWKEASSSFRKAVPEERWTTGVRGVRSPLGAVLHRELRNATYSTHLPGAPDGQYVVSQYQTRFENKADAIETVVAQQDTDGSWRISGYYVK